MLKEAIEKLLVQESLTQKESSLVIQEILHEGNTHQVAAFLALMRAKGESVEELSGVIEAMQQAMTSVSIESSVFDMAGTGGDGANTVNISTGSAILAAACGVKMVKHGGRSSSSASGSADVLEALGIDIHSTPDRAKQMLETIGITFLYAPDYHPAMQAFKEVRRGLKMRTLFNFICPLLNPARPDFLMMGIADAQYLEKAAAILATRPYKRALVFHGNGLDELTPIGPAEALLVSDGKIEPFHLDPQELGFKRCRVEDLKGGDAVYNAALLIEAFEGKEGPIADTLILNAAVALYLYGLAHSVREGISIARTNLKQKKALELLNTWRNA